MDIESGSAARPARDGDEAALAALWEACGLTRPWNDPATDIAFARGGPASDVLVIEREGRIAASVMAGHDGHRGAVYYVAADPARRGEGLGRAIMAAAEDWLRARGVWKLDLMVRRGNEGAMGFYAALGYGEEAVLVMSKRLGGRVKEGFSRGAAEKESFLHAEAQSHREVFALRAERAVAPATIKDVIPGFIPGTHWPFVFVATWIGSRGQAPG